MGETSVLAESTCLSDCIVSSVAIRSNPVTGTSDGRRVVTPPPPLGPVRKTLPYSPLRQNPTDVRRQDTTIQLTKLGDWLSERLKSRIPSEGEERDVQRAKGRRLSRDLRGFDGPEEDPTPTPPEQLLQEGKEWFFTATGRPIPGQSTEHG